jgi:large subunit ribosomal protein L21
MKFAVVKTGGKQYVVTENQEIYVDVLKHEPKAEVILDTLLIADEAKDLELGAPLVKKGVKALVVEHLKADKVHILRFKSKVRYSRHKGFRQHLTKLKILAI